MCVVCGCGDSGVSPPNDTLVVHPATGDLHFGAGTARVSVPGLSQQRAIKLEADVLGANNAVAAQNRAHFAAHGVTAYNLVSSPGSGKTTLLCATIEALRQRQPGLAVAVIEGDQQTSVDAERIRATGAPAVQVNTGKGCHLDAPMVAQAFARLDLHGGGHPYHPAHDQAHPDDPGHSQEAGSPHHDHPDDHAHSHPHPHDEPRDPGHSHQARSLLFIENVGNLVCPAMWDLGEAAKVAILSVTEGEDKPLKYPDMFAAARLMLINKIDLLPYVAFDVARCKDYVRRVNPGIEILELSATTGAGMATWLDWLLAAPGDADRHDPMPLQIARLEAELARLRALLPI